MGGEDEAGGLCSHKVSLASSRQPGGQQQQLSTVTPDSSPGTSVTSQLPLVLASVLCTLLASVSLVALWLSVKLRHRDPAQLSRPAPALSKVRCYSAAGTPRYNNNKYCIRMSISLTSSGSRISSRGP